MAIVDTFWVKPSGLFASQRWASVDVSDDGIVTAIPVPGKEFINKDNISDYRTNGRTFANDQLITTFCNFTTYTRYNVYAQDAKPFAYVTQDLNDPTCGYETPLPEPSVPPNPFGTPNYGAYRFMDFCDNYGENVNILIEKKNYTGEASEIEVGASQTVLLSYKEVDDKFASIRPLECTLGFINNENFLLKEFYTEDERSFRVTITKGGEIQFRGYIIPDSCAEPFKAPPYEVFIRCTDAIGSLKTVTYPLPVGATFNMRQSFLDVLAYCFAPLNLNLDITTICNLYEKTMPNGLNDDPLSLATFNPLRLIDDTGKIMTSYDVLEEVCKAWGAYIVQSKGKWHFVRANEPSQIVIRQRTYNYTGLFLYANNVENNRIAGSKENSNDLVVLAGGGNETQNAYKRVMVLSQFGKTNSIVYNGDFEAWDGFNFPFWTKYGGINISRTQRYVKNSQGAFTYLENYAMMFNERATPSKYVQQGNFQVSQGDKIKVSYRVGQTTSTFFFEPTRNIYFKMRISLGDYYLYNHDGGNNYEWVNSLATVNNKVNNFYGDLNTFMFSFEAPEAPIDGIMTIQLYGFDNALEGSDFSEGIAPTPIDDFRVSKSSQSADNEIIGILNITDNSRYFTQKPERIDTIFGDFFEREAYTQEIENLYAIYVGLAYSSGWIEYGISSSPVTFGLALSKSIMRAYKQPFIFFNGDLIIRKEANKFSYLDVINFNVPNQPSFNEKRFAFMGGDIDLKTNIISSVKLAEIFDAPGVTIDNSVPYFDGMADPIFVQDANYTPPMGVFTEQFTQEFN